MAQNTPGTKLMSGRITNVDRSETISKTISGTAPSSNAVVDIWLWGDFSDDSDVEHVLITLNGTYVGKFSSDVQDTTDSSENPPGNEYDWHYVSTRNIPSSCVGDTSITFEVTTGSGTDAANVYIDIIDQPPTKPTSLNHYLESTVKGGTRVTVRASGSSNNGSGFKYEYRFYNGSSWSSIGSSSSYVYHTLPKSNLSGARYIARAVDNIGKSSYEYSTIFDVYFFEVLSGVSLPEPNNPIAKTSIDYIREKVNEFREGNGFDPIHWTDSTIVIKATPIMAVHWNEIEDSILEVYEQLGVEFNSPDVRTQLEETIKAKDKNYPIQLLSRRIDSILKALQNI